jgi:hypothetical protein
VKTPNCVDCDDTGLIGCAVRTDYCTCPAGRELLQLTCEFNEELKHDAEGDHRELRKRQKRDGK